MKEEPNTTKNLSIGGMKMQQCRVGSELDVGMELKLRKKHSVQRTQVQFKHGQSQHKQFRQRGHR